MKISIERIIDAVREDDGCGFCTSCGEEQYGCEPDARNYECENCGKMKVFGAAELLFMTTA